MKPSLSKKEALEFKRRWEIVNREEIRELRKTSPLVKLRQLASLMFSVEAFGWEKALTAGELEVRRRWNRLRKLCHV